MDLPLLPQASPCFWTMQLLWTTGFRGRFGLQECLDKGLQGFSGSLKAAFSGVREVSDIEETLGPGHLGIWHFLFLGLGRPHQCAA